LKRGKIASKSFQIKIDGKTSNWKLRCSLNRKFTKKIK
jgi:hypothetical protein